MVDRTTPSAFEPYLTNATVQFLPLVRDQNKKWNAGWCTDSDGFEENPDVEVMCGGENHKTPKAAGIWRQGNLLHFGFEQSPAEMNETGQRLLLNSIVYIGRFTEDRPIAITPSVFAGTVSFPRTYLDRHLGEKGDASEVAAFLSNEILRETNPMGEAGVRVWYREHRKWLHPGPDLKLEIDKEAKRLNAPIDKPEFFERAIAAFRENKPEGKVLLARYGPAGTETFDSADAWERWFKENKGYLFFSDQGDYRWYIDPLAKKRKTPSAELRGPARTSMP